jgi:ABC-type phosphate transport system substrate-binding protein
MQMKKRYFAAAAVGMVAVGLVGMTPVANASVPPATGQNGFDGIPQEVTGGGSDTTYNVQVDIGTIYNRSQGCELNLSPLPPFQCSPAVPAPPNVQDKSPIVNPKAAPGGSPYFGNYDHDNVAQAAPFGSSAGINSLNIGGQGCDSSKIPVPYVPAIDFARSSRAPRSSAGGDERDNCTFWGFAQDGIVLESYGRPVISNLTTAQLVQIYTCSVPAANGSPANDWGSLGFAPGPIQVWGMNTNSGTYGTFNSYIQTKGGLPTTFDIDSQSCVKKLADGTFPFENDSKNIINDPGFDNTNALWWGSLGEYLSFGYKRQTATAWRVDNRAASLGNVFNLLYPITRTIYHVTKNTDVDCVTTGQASRTCTAQAEPDVNGTDNPFPGATSGTGGAVREYTRALCRLDGSPNSSTDPFTGKLVGDEISSAISGNNFTPVNAVNRTPGYRCQIQT